MVKIPLTNSPNQRFTCTVPINGENKNLRFELWFNYKAKYWLLSLSDVDTESYIFSNLPLLSSHGKFYDILCQLDYKKIGICVMLPVQDDSKSQAGEENLGTSYVMIWGDNNE
jgi:hypothetical protein|nr:MAG TPA: hypothetical protein [Caudoviricetes sp.]